MVWCFSNSGNTCKGVEVGVALKEWWVSVRQEHSGRGSGQKEHLCIGTEVAVVASVALEGMRQKLEGHTQQGQDQRHLS